jgi:glycerol-3-phosphate acyltransferase PlsY
MIAGLGAFVGHLFPVWLGFKGGKGVATYLGVLIGLAWPAALAFAAIWLALAGSFRYSSLASLLACAATPAVLAVLGLPREAVLFIALTALVWIMHHANIRRLLAGTEGRIGSKA